MTRPTEDPAETSGPTHSEDPAEGSELTRAIGRPAHRAFALEGIRRYDELAERTERELLALHGVGPRAIRILREELSSRGLAFRTD